MLNIIVVIVIGLIIGAVA